MSFCKQGNRVLLVNETNFQVVERTVSKLLSHVIKRMLELVLEMLRVGALGWCCRHDCGGRCGFVVAELVNWVAVGPKMW